MNGNPLTSELKDEIESKNDTEANGETEPVENAELNSDECSIVCNGQASKEEQKVVEKAARDHLLFDEGFQEDALNSPDDLTSPLSYSSLAAMSPMLENGDVCSLMSDNGDGRVNDQTEDG